MGDVGGPGPNVSCLIVAIFIIFFSKFNYIFFWLLILWHWQNLDFLNFSHAKGLKGPEGVIGIQGEKGGPGDLGMNGANGNKGETVRI